MDLKIPEEQFRTIVSDALLKTISKDTRDTLIQGAIQHLMTPPSGATKYGPTPKSPLTEAFEHAVMKMTQELIREELANNQSLRSSIKTLISDTFDRMLDIEADPEKYGKLCDRLDGVFSEYLSGDLKERY